MTAEAAPATERIDTRRIVVPGLVLLALLAALVGWAPGWLTWVQWAWFDACQVMKPRAVTSRPVTIVEIDERSLARIGQWPWPRSLMAELVGEIARHDPAAIGIDLVMSEPDRLSPERVLVRERKDDPVLAARLDALPSNDALLANAMRPAPVVLAVVGTEEKSSAEPMAPPFVIRDRADSNAPDALVASALPRFEGARLNIAELDRAATGHGVISAAPGENVIRRVPLAFRIGDRYAPSLGVEMLRVAFGARDIRLYAHAEKVEAISVGDLVVPSDPDGQVRVYYSRHDPDRFVSAVDVLEHRADPVSFERKLVLIGATGVGNVDYQITPLAQRMPGSEIHAQLLENVFDHTWLSRPRWASASEVAALVLLGILLVTVVPRSTPLRSSLVLLACIAALIAGGFWAFAGPKLALDAALPSLALALLFTALLLLTLSEAARQRRAMADAIRVQREQAAHVAGELEAARRIQLGFLPRPGSLGTERRVDIAGAMTPARDVGGDLYDYFALHGDRLFLLIGDVAGKGLSASLFMAVGKALYKSITLRNPAATSSELMRAANEEISRDNPEMFFVTAFAGVLELTTGHVDFCNAGHENPYLFRPGAGAPERLADGAGPPLCTVDRFRYASGIRQLDPGDVLFLITDGVIDARNVSGERYGSERVQAVLGRVASGMSATAMVDEITSDIAAFTAGAEAADDLTVLAVRWIGPD